MSVFGVILEIVQKTSSSNAVKAGFDVIFGIFTIIWSTVFIEQWKRQEVLFSLEFGQEGFEKAEAERPALLG